MNYNTTKMASRGDAEDDRLSITPSALYGRCCFAKKTMKRLIFPTTKDTKITENKTK